MSPRNIFKDLIISFQKSNSLWGKLLSLFDFFSPSDLLKLEAFRESFKYLYIVKQIFLQN